MKSFRTGSMSRTIAHRGGSGIRPENTLEAFRHAYALGVRTFELDVHLSADGVVVVHHDETLDRTTNGTGPIEAKTVADLQSLDAAYRFVGEAGDHPFRGRGITIPRLDQVTTEFPDVTIVVELKPIGEPIARAMRRFCDAYRVHDRLCIAGFDEPTLAAFRALPGRRVRSSGGRDAISRFWFASRVGLDRVIEIPFDMLQVPPVHGAIHVTNPRFIRAAHRRGIEVHVWTIDEVPEMRTLLDAGVDAIITDRPDRMVAFEPRARIS